MYEIDVVFYTCQAPKNKIMNCRPLVMAPRYRCPTPGQKDRKKVNALFGLFFMF